MNVTAIDETEPFHTQLSPGNRVIDTDTGTAYEVETVTTGHPTPMYEDDIAEQLTLRNLSTNNTHTITTFHPDEPTLTQTLIKIPQIVIDNPELVVTDYLEHHLETDLSVLGRTHPHSHGGSIALIEYAINQTTTCSNTQHS